MNGFPKITVLIISYKQEKLIKRAIDSLLQQKEYLYEICVSDDCSPDNTWEVLQEYSRQYPGFFKLHQNNPNVGIFENIEYSWTMPSGDLVYQLSGDDECPDGWFKSVVELIHKENIDYLNKRVCIYGDYKCLYPNGDYFIKNNSMAVKPYDLVSLEIRKFIGNRSACYSTSIMRRFFKVSQGRSYVAEWAQEVQLPLFTEKAYYIHEVGNIYYTRIGVNMTFDLKTKKERIDNYPYMRKCLEGAGYSFSPKDIHYVNLQKLKYEQLASWSLKRFLLIQFVKLRARDSKYGLFNPELMSVRRTVFAIMRRLPHHNPIKMNI